MGSTGFHHRNPSSNFPVFFIEALMSNLRYWPSQNGVYETLEASQKRSQQDDVVLRWSWVDFITKSCVPACSCKGQCMWMEICEKTMSKPLLLWLTPINLIRKLLWQKDLHFVMNHSFKWVCFVIFFYPEITGQRPPCRFAWLDQNPSLQTKALQAPRIIRGVWHACRNAKAGYGLALHAATSLGLEPGWWQTVTQE